MITFDQLEAEIRRLANENPEYKYPSGGLGVGYYRENARDSDPKPACIFGQALVNLGIEIQDRFMDKSITTVLYQLKIKASPEQKIWVNNVQVFHDQGKSWKDIFTW